MTQREVVDIEKFAGTIRDSLELQTPVDPEKIVEKLGGEINIRASIEDEKEAKIMKRGDSFAVYIKKGTPANRKRFSIAHEIGHLFLHMGFIINPDKWAKAESYNESVKYRYGYSVEEREANEFAAALLMPKYEFMQISEKHLNDDSYRLKPIADYFKVSVDAVRLRGRYLGLFSWD